MKRSDLPTSPRLPHARGGVSDLRVQLIADGVSSPRTWGCFHRGIVLYWHGLVFPTHVGVFRIAGYLVGTVERFNDAKQAEVMDQVKHTV